MEFTPAHAPLVRLPLSAVALIRLSSDSTNKSAVLSINLQGGGPAMEPSEVAGVVRAAHWNNFTKKKATP